MNMNEAFKKSVRRVTYSIAYFASLCNWLADALSSIPDYKPPAGKTIEGNFKDTESTGT